MAADRMRKQSRFFYFPCRPYLSVDARFSHKNLSLSCIGKIHWHQHETVFIRVMALNSARFFRSVRSDNAHDQLWSFLCIRNNVPECGAVQCSARAKRASGGIQFFFFAFQNTARCMYCA